MTAPRLTPSPSSETAEPAEPADQPGFDIRRCIVFDVECYPGRWMVGFLSYDANGNPVYFCVENDPRKLKAILDRIAASDRILVGYNSDHYDKVMLLAVLRGYDAYEISQAIIDDLPLPDDLGTKYDRPALGCDHIDIAARLRRGGGFPSLKLAAARIGRPRLRELPHLPGSTLTDAEWEEVAWYNRVDLDHTWALLVIFVPELESLDQLSREQGRDLRSTSTPRVCEEVFITAFVEKNGYWPMKSDPPHAVWYRPVEGVVRPTTPAAGEWFDLVTSTPLEMTGPPERRKPKVPKVVVEIGGRDYKIGSGGLHSVDPARIYYRTIRHRLVSADVSSFYPSLISKKNITPRSLGDVGAETYGTVLDRRLDLKRRAAAETDPEERRRLDVQATALKLVQNSYFGKFGDSWSRLYDPEAMLAVTLSGQLLLVDLIERLVAAGITVVSANTDGIVAKVRRTPRTEKRFAEILTTWQRDTEMVLEIEDLRRFASTATNNYTQTTAKRKVKRKGTLKGDLSPLTSANHLIIGDAITAALLKDVPPERTIRECRDPVRFCAIASKSKKSTLVLRGPDGVAVDCGKVVRWYRAKGMGQGTLLRQFEDGRMQKVGGADAATLAADIVQDQLPADLDTSWYIAKARAVIQTVTGYFHTSKKHLAGHPEATRLFDMGLTPCPKWGGKNQPKGSKKEQPSTQWEYERYRTFGCYTGPKVGVLVVDVDVVEKFHKWVENLGARKPKPGAADRWESFAGCLVSYRGDATPDGVRAGTARGKMIFRLNLPENHRFTKVSNGRLLKSYGFEVFYSHGIPTVLGEHPDGTTYVLDGDALAEAPGWLVDVLTPKERPKKPKPERETTDLLPFGDHEESEESALDRLEARLVDLDPMLNPMTVGWVKKTVTGSNEAEHQILVGWCPFVHDSGSVNEGELSAGITTTGVAWIKCQHASCVRVPEIDHLLRLPGPLPDLTEVLNDHKPATTTTPDEPAVETPAVETPAVEPALPDPVAPAEPSEPEAPTFSVPDAEPNHEPVVEAVPGATTKIVLEAASEPKVDPSTNGHVPHRLSLGTSPRPSQRPLRIIPGPDLDLDLTLSNRPCTDIGNAERLFARFGADIRYCHPWKKWLVWDGRRWKEDDIGDVQTLAVATVRKIRDEMRACPDKSTKDALGAWALKSESNERVKAMLEQCRSMVPILHTEMDTEPWVLNVANGTIDLKTGELRAHRRADLLTKLCDVSYDANATCPNWDDTLNLFFSRTVTEEQESLIAFFRRACGYAITAVVQDHVLLICYGTGANGKSTMLGTLLNVLGPDYAMKAPPDLLIAKKQGGNHPTEKAALFGKRVVCSIEADEGSRLDEPTVKELSGGDDITARRMREDFWTFKPTHTLFMAVNHKPKIRGTDHGIWRRIVLIPFTVAVNKSQADKGMMDKLKLESPGILNWLVKGCLAWQKDGLTQPAEVTKATKAYQEQEDVLGQFLEEVVIKTPGQNVRASILFARYRNWAERGNQFTMSNQNFSQALVERGYCKDRVSEGVYYLDITLAKNTW